MATFGSWIKRTIRQVLDPDYEKRIAEIAKLILTALQQQRDNFSLRKATKDLPVADQELYDAARYVYRHLLAKAWKDGKVTAAERAVLHRAAAHLQITPTEARAIQQDVAKGHFASALAKFMDNGAIEAGEALCLETIAASVDSSLGDFVNTFFLSEVEAFLRGIFAASIESGMLADDAWERLVQTTDRLGLPTRALSSAILPQALQLIEHVLANAKSDGEFTEAEEAQIQDLLCKLSIPNEERRYIDKAVSALATIRRARKGQLPVVPCPTGLAVRAGEIIHFHAPAAWRQVRVLKSGNVLEEHVGTVTITDNRLFFSSSTKSFDVRYAKIVGHAGGTGKILLQRMEKPECSIHVREDEPFMYAILEGAIALANQTRLARRTDEGPVRHIPRDVRQRVWQRYGGRCAECGDGQYLEFDHVIPFAKGGGNSDNNVQLLCRSCNLKKSDRI